MLFARTLITKMPKSHKVDKTVCLHFLIFATWMKRYCVETRCSCINFLFSLSHKRMIANMEQTHLKSWLEWRRKKTFRFEATRKKWKKSWMRGNICGADYDVSFSLSFLISHSHQKNQHNSEHHAIGEENDEKNERASLLLGRKA